MTGIRKIRALLTAATICACFSATGAALGHPSDDIKQAQTLIDAKEYAGAVELLLGVTGDSQFCGANPLDCAAAWMLLSDSYRATKATQENLKTAGDAAQSALVQYWAASKKQGASTVQRLQGITEACATHPNAMATLLKQVLPRLTGLSGGDPANDVSVALGLYKQVVSKMPEGANKPDVDLMIQIADCYRILGKYDKSVGVSEDMLSKSPDMPAELKGRILMSLVETYISANDSGKIVEVGQQLLQTPFGGPCRSDVGLAVARSLEKEGHRSEAIRVLKSLLDSGDLLDANASLLNDLGGLLIRSNQYADAVAVYKQIRSSPAASDDAKLSAAYNIGLCCWEQGSKSAAVRWMVAVSQQDSTGTWGKKARMQLYEWYKQKS